MPKQTTLFASIEVMPIQTENPETHEEEDGKQLVFTDPATGEVMFYPMGKELADATAKKLRMSNKALIATVQDEQRRAEARAQVLGTNGSPVSQEDLERMVREHKEGGGK